MTIRETEILAVGGLNPDEGAVSGVSWAAVIAGALAAVAVSLVLMLVGSGLSLTMVSPWSNAGVTATTFAVSTIIWLIVVQWLSSATGGYLTGRLRKRWSGVVADEVTFRDTAHGFLSWALATIIVAALLTSAVSAITGGAVQTVTTVAGGAAQGAAQGATQAAGNLAADPTGYFVDTLFRNPAPADAGAPAAAEGPATPAPAATAETPETTPPAAPVDGSQAAPQATGEATAASTSPEAQSTRSGQPAAAAASSNGDIRAEAGRILATGAVAGEISATDKSYLAQLVAEETGLTATEAQARVDGVLAQVDAAKAKATEAADEARKASATLAILMALALVIGAFIASVAAALGGRQRDAI